MNVLISGASVGGPVLAHWLKRQGADVTVVERAPAPRRGGQAVDIRGAALEVAARMGILEQARALKTDMRGMSMLDGDGNEVMRTTEETVSGGRLDSPDVEIMRDDLIALVIEATSGVEYLYGDSISALHQDDQGVDVTFEQGGRRRFDYVVGADGLHSNVRGLVFGEESRFLRHLGMYVAIYSADNFLGLDRWQIWYREGDAGFGIYTAPGNATIKVNVGFAAGPISYDHRDVEQQRRLIQEHCGGLRWEAPRLLKAMWEAGDFYFDTMAQITMERWSEGRVTLVGDAGYCASPLSGQGTSLAMVGAYVLAQELGGDPHGAFERYETRMRPFVQTNQDLALENPGQAAAPESVQRAANAITLD
ncbi:FAD-dependent monooxygenase [Nonomuraea rhizosphaerae]|uniref:FAD-dependent monooxygenase n=1 Tax=Nonomuraea rhizosphaerae TaxID=2665663 RepID=UPI001C6072A0|nr:FAD-dependent monooxygenase [Nonomuraea rhizosphaerae]